MDKYLQTLTDGAVAYVQSMPWLEAVSVFFAIAYLILAMRQNIWCWFAGGISTGIGIYLFWDATLFMESAVSVYYLIMAFYGWWSWHNTGVAKATEYNNRPIRRWRLQTHIMCLIGVCVLSLITGYALNKYTEATYPYLDSLTTWAAVLTTYMVAKKILSNWTYWVVIDSALIYLYSAKGLYLYAILMIVYVVMAIIGQYQWWRVYRSQSKQQANG